MTETTDIAQLRDALEGGRVEQTNRLVDVLTERAWNERIPSSVVESTLRLLRQYERFDLIVRLGDAAITADRSSPSLTVLYCQALIEIGALHAAQGELERLAASEHLSPMDESEIHGLLGRTWKQRFLAGHDPGDYHRALERYRQGLELGADVVWHGANVVALQSIGRRSNVLDRSDLSDASAGGRALAERILHEAMDSNMEWSLAVQVEMSVALGDVHGATNAVGRLLKRDTAMFKLQSLRRQLRDVWGLDIDHPVLLRLDEGVLSAGSAAALDLPESADAFEKIFGQAHALSYRNLAAGLVAAESVGRVVDRNHKSFGTAFLLPGTELNKRLGSDLVLVTNAHVVAEDGSGVLEPEWAKVVFDVTIDESGEPLVCDRLAEIWSSSKYECDITILQFSEGQPRLRRPLETAKDLPTITEGVYVTVIGHPGGSDLSLSIRGNDLLEYDPQRHKLHYLAPTLGGSSGSPIFDSDWNLIGVHHAGWNSTPRLADPTTQHAANEGIALGYVRQELDAALS